jgi:GNAT superfamily N-acetyltransferase
LTKNLFRISRLVVLPDYQGLGIGNIMNEWIGEFMWKEGRKRLSIVTTHPGLILSYSKSPKWKMNYFKKGARIEGDFDKSCLSTRLKSSFLYIPENYKKNMWDI